MAYSRTIVGIAWFRADQWQQLRSLAADPEVLEQTHAEWESLAEKSLKDLARADVLVRKIDVDINELRDWCMAQKRPLDGAARAAYAAVRVRNESENA